MGAAATGRAPAGPPPAASHDSLQPGHAFGRRYQIIRLLGVGGMGAVYQAWDSELGEAVALKTIRADISTDPAAAQALERRFKHELQLARQVTHKNVVRIHDLGEIDGLKYISMPFIEGSDLARMLDQKGKLPVATALRLARQIAAGLQAAHEAGIVHRDLKPANIMVERDRALITDFGIARSEAQRVPAAAVPGRPGELGSAAALPDDKTYAATTTVGMVVGTVDYMAPEQARAEPVDHRADIYAFGLILYDMILGLRRARRKESAADELAQRLTEAPPSLRSLDPQIPEPLDRVVTRCLQPDPATRYQTTAELVGALNRLDDQGKSLPLVRRLTPRLMAMAALVLIAAVAGTYFVAVRMMVPPVQPDPISVLVANFDNTTGNEVFKDTLETAMGTALEGASFVNLYPRSGARDLIRELSPGRPLDVSTARLIAAREGIKVIVGGTVERTRSGYSLRVEAIDPANGNVLSTSQADAPSPERMLVAVNTAAARLRGALGDTTPESARLAAAETVTTSSLEALQVYLRAQELAAGRRDQEALETFREAVALDPDFARAYAGMGNTYFNIKDLANARAAYDKALKLLDRMSDREKYRTLGTYYLGVALNYVKAVETYETLVKLFPADEVAHTNLGVAYLYTGDVQRAIAQAREVLKLNPRSVTDRYNLAIESIYAGDFETALTEANRSIKDSPDYYQPYLPVALAALYQGDLDGARASYEAVEKVSPIGGSLGRLGRADLMMYRGLYREALSVLQQGITQDEKAGNTNLLGQQYVALAEVHLALGQSAQGAAAARKAATLSEHEAVRFPSALVLVEAGRNADAENIATAMENTLQSHMTAYAELVRAAIAVRSGRLGQAIELFRASLKRRDTWLGRFMLGRLYVDTGRNMEAIAELETCMKRYGEAGDVFFYDFPTARYLPPLYYYLGRAQEALGVASAKANYERFLSLRGNAVPADALILDVRKRLRG